MKTYCVYIMASGRRTLYVGVTGDLQRRVHEHRHKLVAGFTKQYNVTHLVYYEEWTEAHQAIAREKQLKRWSRAKKLELIRSVNPKWKDLVRGGTIAPRADLPSIQ